MKPMMDIDEILNSGREDTNEIFGDFLKMKIMQQELEDINIKDTEDTSEEKEKKEEIRKKRYKEWVEIKKNIAIIKGGLKGRKLNNIKNKRKNYLIHH